MVLVAAIGGSRRPAWLPARRGLRALPVPNDVAFFMIYLSEWFIAAWRSAEQI